MILVLEIAIGVALGLILFLHRRWLLTLAIWALIICLGVGLIGGAFWYAKALDQDPHTRPYGLWFLLIFLAADLAAVIWWYWWRKDDRTTKASDDF